MRVCHIVPSYPFPESDDYAGIQFRVLFRSLAGIGVECVGICGLHHATHPRVQDDGGVRVRRFAFGDHLGRSHAVWRRPVRAVRYLYAGLRCFREEHRRRPVALIHAHSPIPAGILALLAGWLERLPVVLTLHGSDILLYPRKRMGATPIVRWVLRRARRVMAAGEVLAEAAREYVPDLRVQVLPMGYDDTVYGPGLAAEARDARVVSTRTLSPLYDVATLVEALEYMADLPALRVDIFGEGPQRPELESRAVGLPVTFRGRAAAAVLSDALRSAAIYVSTSTSDGTSVSLLEAMACGTYPLVTDIPANRAWITDGVNGRLFPAGDSKALAAAIVSALSDAPHRHQSALVNGRRVQSASASTVARTLRGVYECVAGEAGMPSPPAQVA